MYFEFYRRPESIPNPKNTKLQLGSSNSQLTNDTQKSSDLQQTEKSQQTQSQQQQQNSQDANAKNFIVQENDNKNNVPLNINQNSNKFGQIESENKLKISMASVQNTNSSFKNEQKLFGKKSKSLKVKKFNEGPTFGERIGEYFNCINQENAKKSKTVTLPVVEFDTEGDMPMVNKEFTNDFNELTSDEKENQIENEKVKKIKHYIKITVKFAFSQMGLAGLVIGYVILGSIIFMKIEKDFEKQNQEKIQMNREEFFHDVRISAEYIVNEYLKTNFHLKYNQYRNEELYGKIRVTEAAEENVFENDYENDDNSTTTKRIMLIKDKLKYPENDLSRASWAIKIDENKFRKEIDHLLKIFLNENDKLDDKDSSPNAQQEVWTYSSALLYSATVITTIGYGNITPKSSIGKIFTMFYAMIGIPLMFMCLTNTGDLLAELFITVYSKSIRLIYRLTCKHKLKMHYSASRYQEKRENMLHDYENEYDNPEDKHVPIIATIGVLSAYIFSGAVIFSYWENWTYLDGAYFCFITFTTIGFGDFVPGKNTLSTDKGGKAVLCCLYLLAGMIIMAMCFKLMQDEVFSKARWIGKKLGIVD